MRLSIFQQHNFDTGSKHINFWIGVSSRHGEWDWRVFRVGHRVRYKKPVKSIVVRPRRDWVGGREEFWLGFSSVEFDDLSPLIIC